MIIFLLGCIPTGRGGWVQPPALLVKRKVTEVSTSTLCVMTFSLSEYPLRCCQLFLLLNHPDFKTLETLYDGVFIGAGSSHTQVDRGAPDVDGEARQHMYTGQIMHNEIAPRRSSGISCVYDVHWSPVESFTDLQLRLGSRLHTAGSILPHQQLTPTLR